MNKLRHWQCYPYLVCIISGLFIFYKYLLQISPSVMSSDLMRDFHLTGAGLGNLTASFLYTYFLMQIPSGMILDQYNPRKVIVTTLVTSTVFTLVFARTSSVLTAGIARAGIGFTTAFAFNAYLKMVTVWVPPKHFAVMSGLGLTIAMLGAMGGEAPLGMLVVNLGWRDALVFVAGFGLVLALLCGWLIKDKFLAVNENNETKKPPAHKQIIAQLLDVIGQRQNWILGLYCAFTFAPISAFGGLWGVPFLEQAYHLSRVTAAKNISFIYLGLAIGCPLLGWVSDYLNKRISVMAIGTLVGLICISSVIYLSATLTPLMVAWLLFIFGLSMGVFLLCFAVAVEIQTTIFMATLIAFINTLPSVFEAITEPLIGKILDLGWDGKLVDGARVFSINNFHVGLAVIPIYLVIALMLLMLAKGRQQKFF
ncbi:MAG TPA: MFS transporter [Gammaproteobacteria bacterium]|nr:MFS transporter [Gammaproteobacteria bacterium]